ncbi:Tripartite DNA replication factor [Mortierella hygrophila]|uniref:Tripartite DNA replication factor n=1 Tax=Mortierella hygrophila TaxID=979708 RepID=A0A9P6FCE0_9FUNG|nr:Tripartite DNA replication factor [Mortierella hygrophila]
MMSNLKSATFRGSKELMDLLRSMGLLNINSSSNDEPSSAQQTDTDDPANQPTLPFEDKFYTVTVQETTTATSSSVRSSLEYSFGSLQVTDEDWLAIDEVTAAHTTAAPVLKDTQPAPYKPAPYKPLSTSTTTSEVAKFKFSPSVLAHHANTACEKMLHLKGRQLWDQALQQKATPELAAQEQEQRAQSPVAIADATTRRGVVFESQLQSGIKDRVDCEADQDKDSYFRLATTPDNTTLCQPVFSLDKSFYTQEMEKAGIIFGRFIPDFIQVLPGSVAPDGTRKKRIFIIDAKSSSHVKISHQFQVTLYAIFLDHLIRINRQTDLVEVALQGGVWTPDRGDPHVFSLAFMRPIIENFIYKELPAILTKPLNEAVWHIDSPCLQCEFLDSCKDDAREQMTLSLIPMLSKKSALAIKAMCRSRSGKGKNEIEDIEDLVANRSSLPDTHQNFLKKELRLDDNGVSPLIQSYKERVIKVVPVRTMELPRQHDDRLLINLLIDPMTLLPYAYSLDMFKEQMTRSSHNASGATRWSSHLQSERLSHQIVLAVELIDTLHEWLVNLSGIKPKAPVLTIFFYNREMLSGLSNLLLRVVSSKSEDTTWSPLTKGRAMNLLTNMYEDPSFLTLSEVSGSSVRLPDLLQLAQGFKKPYPSHDKRLFSIETALNALLVLPVVGSYTFKDLMTYLVDVEAPFIIDDKDRNDDGFDSANIFRTWSTTDNPDAIKALLQKWAEQQNVILIALYAVVRQEHNDLKDVLLAPQSQFKMRPQFKFKYDLLAQFAFFLQWEVIMQAQKRRQRRINMTNEEATRHQFAFRCRYLNRHLGPFPAPGSSSPSGAGAAIKEPSNSDWSGFVGKFEITSPINPGVLTNDDFKQWILSPDTPAGHGARMQYDEVNSVFKMFGVGVPAVVSTSYFDPETKIVYLKGTYRNMTSPNELCLAKNEYYILERRELNVTLTTTMKKLIEMNEDNRLFLKLLTNPNMWGEQRPDKSADVFLESITNSTRRYDMTISQEQAFTRVISNRLQIIWGPPGSGKTHFLALTILRFVDIMQSLAIKGKGQGPQTIVLTAFTHSAINTLVKRVAQLHRDIAFRAGAENVVQPLVFYRLSNAQACEADGVQQVDPKDLAKLQRRPGPGGSDQSQENIIRIVSGTVWQIRRAAHPETGVDYMRNVQMLMIDEGSQLLAADSIHAIECLDPDHGRLVVAGDHLQLGPIIAGEYPKSELPIDPTGSIMKNLMRKKDNTPVSLQWEGSGPEMDVGPCTFQLQDNFRMNEQLGKFMQLIYGPKYVVRNPERSLPYSESVVQGMSFPPDIRRILDPSLSAVCIELQLAEDLHSTHAIQLRNDIRVAASVEATLVVDIVEAYLEMVGRDTITTLFVAVPHHVQRLAILDRVERAGLVSAFPMALIKVDTIEKMQGQEADMVVVCFGMFDEATLVNELAYLYSVHRWVVALSRARCKTVLLITPEIKAPRIIGGSGKTDAGSLERLDGWGLLQAFERYAEGLGGKLVWPINNEFLQGAGIHLL